ncbi:tape measure protein [Sporosarcina jeotgali]|uniref:Tape measure protein n=1 Tax=Sporosarcina jeotgali TaxID=3020056 RepID=A0ABZ0KUU5_9BACL|nr:tape measure protein [Sporosarcina sp. B2O-1]WOV83903.1 tape measure protein [Sporosarcina sp. B2O-1]
MAGNRVISAVLTLKDKDFGTTAQKSASAMKDLERKTKHSGNTISKFGKSATASLKGVAAGASSIVAAIGVTKALSGAFNMVRSSVTSAFDRIDTMERFERTMTTITGSSEQVKAALEATRDAVTGTGYGLDTAAQSVQNFVTRGMDINKATKTVAQWGDAVAFYGDGSNEQFETVSDAIGKMYSSGKVSLDQLNRLTDVGINATDMYAKAVGRDSTSVAKDLSKGKISAEEFFDVVGTAMMEGTNGVQKVAGAAKEAGASWGNTWTNMRASVTRGVEDIIKNVDKMLVSNGLPDMRSMVSNFGKKFESVLLSASDKIPLLSGGIVGMYTAVKPGLDWLKDTAFPAIKTELQSAFETSRPVLEWIKDNAFPAIVEAAKTVVEGFTDLYNFVKDNLPLLTPIVAGVTTTVLAFKGAVVLVEGAMKAWQAATIAVEVATALLNGTLTLSPLGWVALAIGGVVAAGIALYQNWDTVKAKTAELWQKLQDNPLMALALGPMGVLVATGVTLYKNFDKIKATFNAFKETIKNFVLPKWVATIGKTLAGAAEKVRGIAGGRAPMDSFAVGTNRVTHDQVAQIHKDEMIVPAVQSRNARKQGININNIDKQKESPVRPVQVKSSSSKGSNNVFNININGHNLTVDQIMNEMVRKIERANFNMA